VVAAIFLLFRGGAGAGRIRAFLGVSHNSPSSAGHSGPRHTSLRCRNRRKR
jgi:hypothetical protein